MFTTRRLEPGRQRTSCWAPRLAGRVRPSVSIASTTATDRVDTSAAARLRADGGS